MPRPPAPKARAATKSVKAKTAMAPSHPPTPLPTKQDQILALLHRPQGASLQDLIAASRWQAHSVRGFLAGTVKKKLGLALVSIKAEGEARCYRIESRRSR